MLLSRLVVNLMWNSILSPFLKGSLESFKAAIHWGIFKPSTFAGSMHKWCDQMLFTSGWRRSQADIIYRYDQKPGIHTMMLFSTIWAVMKAWKHKIPGALTFSKRLPTFLGLTRISALLPGQLVLEYSILLSITSKSSGSQLWSSTMILLLKKRVECALIFATIGSFIYVCKCPLHAPPVFRKKASKLPCFDTKFAPL